MNRKLEDHLDMFVYVLKYRHKSEDDIESKIHAKLSVLKISYEENTDTILSDLFTIYADGDYDQKWDSGRSSLKNYVKVFINSKLTKMINVRRRRRNFDRFGEDDNGRKIRFLGSKDIFHRSRRAYLSDHLKETDSVQQALNYEDALIDMIDKRRGGDDS